MSVSFYIMKNGVQVSSQREVVLSDGEAILVDDLELNVSNMNFTMLFDTLGMPYDDSDLMGTIENLPDFIAKCASYVSLLRANPELDSGRKNEVFGRITICAPPDGYLCDRITQLKALAERANAEGGELVYA